MISGQFSRKFLGRSAYQPGLYLKRNLNIDHLLEILHRLEIRLML